MTLAVVLPTFLLLCNWQVHRALGGNELSWAYVFEWPFFAGYAIYMWWKLLHEATELPRATAPAVPTVAAAGAAEEGPASPEPVRPGLAALAASPDARQVRTGSTPDEPANTPDADSSDDADDRDLAAYNRYLAELNASGRPKRW